MQNISARTVRSSSKEFGGGARRRQTTVSFKHKTAIVTYYDGRANVNASRMRPPMRAFPPHRKANETVIVRWFAWTRPQSNSSPNPRADADENGGPARFDYQYQRKGTANLFMTYARLEAGAMSRSQIAIPPWITLTS